MTASKPPAGLQTLERGLTVLEVVAEAGACTAADVMARTGFHRSIAYRLLSTLEARGYLRRDGNGRYEIGASVLPVAAAMRTDLQTTARAALAEVAEATGATAFLAIPQGEDAVTLVTVEPPAASTPFSYRPGARHPLTRGAPGLAILAAGPPHPGERAEVTLARELGHVRTTGEVLPGVSSVAVPVHLRDGRVAAACVLYAPGWTDEQEAISLLTAVAERLTAS